MYKILFSKDAQKDAINLKRSGLHIKCQKLIDIIQHDPFCPNPPYEKLIGDLKGFYSRRINIQHRLTYEVDQPAGIVKVLRMWSHYE